MKILGVLVAIATLISLAVAGYANIMGEVHSKVSKDEISIYLAPLSQKLDANRERSDLQFGVLSKMILEKK